MMKKVTSLKFIILLAYFTVCTSILANMFFKIVLLEQKTEIILIWFLIQANIGFLLLQFKGIYENGQTIFSTVSTYNLKANFKIENLRKIYMISIPSFLLLQWQTIFLMEQNEARVVQRLLNLETFAIVFSTVVVMGLIMGLFMLLSIKRMIKSHIKMVFKSLTNVQIRAQENTQMSLFILLDLIATQIRIAVLNWHHQDVILPLLADESLLKRIYKKHQAGILVEQPS
ncbi:hypothetical protein [Mesoplasma seiffertii]|uniref:hypothetical protein n=1 Tax=Mesoplasma seiffertii TaxID=28224 RepID=UPI0012EB4065|nr:hypothetical protein [Mesoplasma seiffertii]